MKGWREHKRRRPDTHRPLFPGDKVTCPNALPFTTTGRAFTRTASAISGSRPRASDRFIEIDHPRDWPTSTLTDTASCSAERGLIEEFGMPDRIHKNASQDATVNLSTCGIGELLCMIFSLLLLISEPWSECRDGCVIFITGNLHCVSWRLRSFQPRRVAVVEQLRLAPAWLPRARERDAVQAWVPVARS